MQLFRALFSRRWWWVTLLVVALMLLLARLGMWQLDRLAERRSANAALAASLAVDPLVLNAVDALAGADVVPGQQAQAAGTFDLDRQLLLLVQNWQNRAGVHLITPLVLPDGETAVLVDRGWIPDADVDGAAIRQYDVTGQTAVEGAIALSQTLSRAADTPSSGPQDAWYRVDVAAIQAQMPYDLLPFYLVQGPARNDALPYRSPPQPDLSEGSHLSYAVQWFIFSAGLGVAYLAFVNKNLRQDMPS